MNYGKQNRNENSHPALKIFKCWVLQFCLFPFNFLLSKLTNQFESIMQNKPNLPNVRRMSKIAVTLVKTRNYNNEQRTMNYELLFKTNPIKPNLSRRSLWRSRIKPNSRKAQMNVTSILTKYYENKRLCRLRRNKPNQTQLVAA